MNKYIYIIIDIADRYYEEGVYIAKFDDFKKAEQYLKKHNYKTLLNKLYFLEDIKSKLNDNEIIISYI